MMRGTTVAVAIVLGFGAPVSGESLQAGSSAQAAPGGGEMIILGPASRYVTRAGVDDRGRVKVDCGHAVDDSDAMTRDRLETTDGFPPPRE